MATVTIKQIRTVMNKILKDSTITNDQKLLLYAGFSKLLFILTDLSIKEESFENKVSEILHNHREKNFISCEETCFCWDIDSLLVEEELKGEQE